MKKFLIGISHRPYPGGSPDRGVFIFPPIRFGEHGALPYSDGATLILQLDSEVPENSPFELPLPFIGTPTDTVTVHERWHGLRQAPPTMPESKAVVLVDR